MVELLDMPFLKALEIVIAVSRSSLFISSLIHCFIIFISS